MEYGSVLLLICTIELVVLLTCICLKSEDSPSSPDTSREDVSLLSMLALATFPILLAIPLLAASTDRQQEEEQPLTEVVEGG